VEIIWVKTMALFYFNEAMKQQELKRDFISLIEQLEKNFNKTKDVQVLLTIIAYSWYCYVEGPCIKKNISDDEIDFFCKKWAQYHELGIKEFLNSPEFCLVAGYSYSMDGFMIHDERLYKEKLGYELIKRCFDATQDENLKNISSYLLNNSRKRKLNNAEQICRQLFPTDSELDEYFKGVLTYSFK